MDIFRPKVIALTKRHGQSFGFYLRVEQNEDGHLIRCLEMGGPAELAGMKDGDRILRVNGAFIDALPHSKVVEMVKNSGNSVTFHILNELAYKQAKDHSVDLADPQSLLDADDTGTAPKAKLCYLVKSGIFFGFSLCSYKDEPGLFITEVTEGSVAEKAGLRVNDRVVEINGENIEHCTHEQVVEKIKLGSGTIMFLLVDKGTDKYYQNKRVKIGTWLATTKHLPFHPRIMDLTRESAGFGFLLRQEPNMAGHIIKEIDIGSPAGRAGIKKLDLIVGVNGKEVTNSCHGQVVDQIRRSGSKCCLLVADKQTAQMYQQGNVSFMLFWEENKDANSPPSYTEAVNLPSLVRSPTLVEAEGEDLKPKLCVLVKSSAGFGFHLNGIQGVPGQYIQHVLRGSVAEEAGLEENDLVVEVNGVNVEQCSHDDAVALIRQAGESLELLVVKKGVYEKLKAKRVNITRLLLGETSYAQVHKQTTPENTKRVTIDARSETSYKAEKLKRSVSALSEVSVDMRF